MKKRDLIYLIIAVAILLVAGYIGYTQIFPPKAGDDSAIQYEVVGPILPDFDTAALTTITDGSKVKDFSVDIQSGAKGNNAIFGR